MESRIYLLIKVFDREEHADAFINQGEMYCRTLGEFKRIEGDEVRGDAYEGVTDWHQPDQIKLVTIDYKDKNGVEHSFPITKLGGPFIVQHTGFDRLNLFCMYALKADKPEGSYETEEERIKLVEQLNDRLKIQSTVRDEVLALGGFAVVIYKIEDFINKVKHTAKIIGADCQGGSVCYYDPATFHGSFNDREAIFQKRNAYAYQNEYRLVLDLAEGEGAMKIHIGSLADIAFKSPTSEINPKVQLRLKET